MCIRVHLQISIAWWVRPYIALTRFGLRLGLPLNIDVAVRDVKKGIRVRAVGVAR